MGAENPTPPSSSDARAAAAAAPPSEKASPPPPLDEEEATMANPAPARAEEQMVDRWMEGASGSA